MIFEMISSEFYVKKEERVKSVKGWNFRELGLTLRLNW